MSDEIITIKNLFKSFTFPVRDSSKGFLKNLLSPSVKSITAVDNISFEIKEGETVAFIGSNGAGKSTTIKMLTGILYPTSGYLSVLRINPQKDRKTLALNIGTVFGQRSQLIFNLPITDSFELAQKVYEVDKETYKRQKGKLIEIFELGDILDQPVRKLSLGQRMRAEVAVSLLHEPAIVFLDEPTIGLDVVAKRKLRENLKTINKELNTTIFLTSHDAGDVETVCERTIVVNHGRIIFDGPTKQLKKEYITRKIIKVAFDDENSESLDLKISGIKILKNNKREASFEVDTSKMSIDKVLKEIVEGKQIEDITIEDPPLEEIIGKIYEDKEA
ncbi:MAG: ATP-binding cassette domain-containing protein [Patescibacteria group bacterium]